MRYEILVDHIARVCVWRTREHYGIDHNDLAIPTVLRQRIDIWIDRQVGLRDDAATHAGWRDYDEEGRQIARQLKPVLGPDAEVFYRAEASEEFERIG